ncbi:junctional adhesion molecule 2A-like [Pectinophora gossypiella]|uniref:junctional adhesion molecule 2A-like n=1 Tax=Pectinophora gossypiella TaxID=13191 RepID=UPI00214ED901|nr:junctional adhesion molecule 2A-like [Pectinophora gossypiella]
MYTLKIMLWMSIVIFSLQGSLCLRDVHMVIPEAVERKSTVEMKCQYDLEQEVLYSVKWYRGDREFCRYSPRDVPPLKIFPIPGIDVNKDETDSKRLTIVNATDVANGRYTCEVSADAPSFQTAQVHGFMYVVDLPSTDPTLSGIKRRYRSGMKLRAECISRNSLPAANLSFFINNEPASSQHVWHRVDGEKGGPMTAYSTIQFVVQRHHFVRGKLKVRCTAIIYTIYRMSVEKCAEEERIRTTPASPPEVHEAIIYSVHRLPEAAKTSAVRKTSPTSLWIIAITSLYLPYILR